MSVLFSEKEYHEHQETCWQLLHFSISHITKNKIRYAEMLQRRNAIFRKCVSIFYLKNNLQGYLY